MSQIVGKDNHLVKKVINNIILRGNNREIMDKLTIIKNRPTIVLNRMNLDNKEVPSLNLKTSGIKTERNIYKIKSIIENILVQQIIHNSIHWKGIFHSKF